MHDYYNIDQLLGVSKYINTLKIPDVWLIDLFEIFETYNFTIDENTSVDIELSIEPEMLGRIFENLLAEINPETGETARKSTGSYYTPRSIVDFMVNESLKQYLLTKTSINESNISSLLAYEEETVELSEAEQDSIIDALDNIKIIDPACGSGAFPMGILQKMLLILQKIDPESRKWAKKKIDRIDNYILKNELQKKIDEGNWNYLHKLGIIQNSIYGVDIQSVAVDISKLRFFLSLIVDENVDDSKPNRGVKPLPNLEFKFVCANSLISLPGKNTQAELFEEAKNIEDLRKLRETYFRSYGNDKKAIEKEFQDIQNEMFRASLLWLKAGKKESQAVKLSQWKPFSGEPCEWFDPDWMFGIKNGFDIVIGNPPYGNLIEKNQKNTLRKVYKFSDLSEISSLFVEKGFDILKKQGCIVFIITFAITFGKNFSKIRFLLNENFEKTSIVTLDRDRCSTFESVTQSVSVFISLNKHPNVHNGIYTSRFFRSFPNLNQIEYSYSNDYLLPLKNVFSNQHRLPKIGENTNKKVLGKLFMYKDVCSKFIDKGEKIWIRTSGNYWYNAFDRKPYESTEIKLLKVDEEYSDFIIILINSSLFYFWFRIYGDGRHMNRDIFGNFPLPQYSDICKNRLLLENVRRVFMERLFSVFDNQRNRFSTSAIKEYIDLLDIILGKYFYNLSYQQIIHILNYDNEIRGGTKLNSHIIDCMNKIILTSKNAPIQRSKEDQYRIQQLENQIDVLIFKEYDI